MANNYVDENKFGRRNFALNGVSMSALEGETPEDRKFRVMELEYCGLPAIVQTKERWGQPSKDS